MGSAICRNGKWDIVRRNRGNQLVGSSAEKCSAELTACKATMFGLPDGSTNSRKSLTLKPLKLYGHCCEKALSGATTNY